MSRQIERRISFNAGEVSSWIDPRIDTEKYRSGCKQAVNMRVMTYGGAISRAGTLLVAPQLNGDNRARVEGFEFSATTTFMLLFTANADDEGELFIYTTGDNPEIPVIGQAQATWPAWATATTYTRGGYLWNVVPPIGLHYCVETHVSGTFATDLAAGKWRAQTSFQLATPYTAAELPELQFAQINDVVFITHPNHKPQVLSRIANNFWTLKGLVQEFPSLRTENITATSLQASAQSGNGVTITASGGDVFVPEHVGSRWLIKHRRLSPYVTQRLRDAVVNEVSEILFVLGDWSLTVTTADNVGQWETVAVVERSYNGIAWETVRSLAASKTERSGIITGTEIDPCWLRIRMDKVDDPDDKTPILGKYTLEATDPDHYGIFDIVGYTDATHVTANIVFPIGGGGVAVPTTRWAEAAWSDYRGWPRSVCIHEQRLMFGGSRSQPQTVWGSVVDDFYNFRLGSDDDMGLALTFAGQKANAVQWMVSSETLILGTAGAEGPVGSREADKPLTPTSARAGRFSSTGSAFIQAIAVQDAVVFVQRNGRKAWEFSFVFESDGYKAQDLTLLAEHITDQQIIQMVLQRYPEPVIWCIDSGGQLLGLAYERNQNVAGWFRYVTDGKFESIAVVSGASEEDQIWVTVERNGLRFVERFQPNRIRMLKDGDQLHLCCSDCSVIYDGAATTTITGLSHLEGRTVCALADGSPVANRIVTSGQVTLDLPAEVVIVGLPFECRLQPTYLETADPNAVAKVTTKVMHRIDLELWKSLGCSVSGNGGETWERVEFLRQGDAMDGPIPLYSGYKEVRCDSRSDQQIAPIIRQNQPLPLCLLSVHIWYEMNAT